MIVSTLQCSILMLFNSADVLSFEDLKTRLNMTPENLKKMLHSLSCKKQKILSKTGEKSSIGELDQFEVNENFTSKLLLFSVPIPQDKTKFVKEKIEQDRGFSIEASIVKLLKSRKKMKHQELINEVLMMLELFKPTSRQIKVKIENLIQREFIERDPEDFNTYFYMA